MQSVSGSKILFIIHEHYSAKIVNEQPDLEFTNEYVSNAKWASRPNSTTRLTLANYAAVRKLRHEMAIEFSTDIVWDESLGDKFGQYDIVVVNAIAGAASISFVSKLLAWKRSLEGSGPFIIMGTEVTWFSAVERGELPHQDAFDVYFGDLLLRHTARTDNAIYDYEKFAESRVQEMELAIDTGMLPRPAPIEDRKRITFVRAPEGRTTKNNEAIDELIGMVRLVPELQSYEIVELCPPYSITNYWDVLAETSFLIFTSVGETFSFALNDANALGVITLRTDQMYVTNIDGRYAVDTYPEIGIPYTGTAHAIELVKTFSSDVEMLREESSRSRLLIERKFSLDALYQNWKKLLSGSTLNKERLFVYGESFLNWNEIVKLAGEFNCRFVLPFENRGVGWHEEQGLARNFAHEGIVLLRYLFTRELGGGLRRSIGYRDDGYAELGYGPALHHVSEFETTAFIHLLIRTYKIGHVVVDRSLLHTEFVHSISGLKVFRGIEIGLAPLTFEFV